MLGFIFIINQFKLFVPTPFLEKLSFIIDTLENILI